MKVFRGSSMQVEDAVHLVLLRIAKWVSNWEKFSLRVDVILHSLDASLHSVFRKDSISMAWSPPVGELKFNVDGATRGKPGSAGVWR